MSDPNQPNQPSQKPQTILPIVDDEATNLPAPSLPKSLPPEDEEGLLTAPGSKTHPFSGGEDLSEDKADEPELKTENIVFQQPSTTPVSPLVQEPSSTQLPVEESDIVPQNKQGETVPVSSDPVVPIAPSTPVTPTAPTAPSAPASFLSPQAIPQQFNQPDVFHSGQSNPSVFNPPQAQTQNQFLANETPPDFSQPKPFNSNIQEHPTFETNPEPSYVKTDPEKEKTIPQYANPNDIKKSPFRFLPILLGALLLIGVAIFGAMWFLGNRGVGTGGGLEDGVPSTSNTTTKQKTITYWGLWEPSSVMQEVIKDFELKHPGIVVKYEQQSPKDYRERLQESIRSGKGPDVFRYHATWVPMLKTQLAILPSSTMTVAEFEQTFFPIYATDLKTSEGIVGIPLMYDGLALFYNTEMLNAANLQPPATWSDLESTAASLRVPAGTIGKIERAGVALGTTSNVDNFSDILGLLLLQNGADLTEINSQAAEEAFQYYTNFYTKQKAWDETLPNSTYAFATEKAAMILAPSWRAFEIQSINPNLQFGIAPAPQLPDKQISWSSYWAEGVSKNSKEKDASWSFLKYLSSKEVMQKFYTTAASKTPRLFGEIYSRKDLSESLKSDTYAGAFITDAPTAQSWYLSSRTFDNGINDKIIKYVGDAINAINQGKGSVGSALDTAQQGITQVLQQYGVQ